MRIGSCFQKWVIGIVGLLSSCSTQWDGNKMCICDRELTYYNPSLALQIDLTGCPPGTIHPQNLSIWWKVWENIIFLGLVQS